MDISDYGRNIFKTRTKIKSLRIVPYNTIYFYKKKKKLCSVIFFLLVVLKFKFRAVVHVSVISKKIEIKRHTLLSLIN
jgi:hypothetical protein